VRELVADADPATRYVASTFERSLAAVVETILVDDGITPLLRGAQRRHPERRADAKRTAAHPPPRARTLTERDTAAYATGAAGTLRPPRRASRMKSW
jgi:hypothetical protein